MNLNEERKAPLREKDLSTKREMVVQYISATAKSVSERLNHALHLQRVNKKKKTAAEDEVS